jgi:ADP-ribose pyrophosphatase YjhB (NUDIX family)
MRSVKHSYGIICCKKTQDGFKLLVIKKGYTYAYVDFVLGKYEKRNIRHLVSKMSHEEKMTIISMNFSQMWYRIWLTKPKVKYVQYEAKFTKYWASNADALKQIINSTKEGSPVWEFPKGKKRQQDESNIVAAVREFTEETGISKPNFQLFDASVEMNKSEDGVIYRTKYFFAVATSDIDFQIRYNSTEIADVKWMSILDMKSMCPQLADISASVIKYMKNRRI